MDTKLNVIVTLATDTALLLIMLVGLLRWRIREGGASSLADFLWTQGLIWLLLATLGHLPAAVFVSLDLNAPFNLMFGASTVTTVSIAATRMYRTLTDYNARGNTISSPIRNGLIASQTNQIHAVTAPIRFNPMEVSVYTDSAIGWDREQCRASRPLPGDSGTYAITDGQLHDKPCVLSVQYEAESGMEK